MTRVFLSVPRYGWCTPLSHPSSRKLVNHGPSQQSSKEENNLRAMEMRCYRKILHISYKDHNYYQRESPCQDPAGNQTTRRPPDHRKEMQTAVVWTCLLFIRFGQNHLAGHSERGKKTRQTEEEVGRQHHGMDRPGVCQVPEGSGEKGKMEETGCEIISGAPMTLTIKGLIMMMMILFGL